MTAQTDKVKTAKKRATNGTTSPPAAAILASIPQPLLTIRKSGHIEHVNLAAEEFFGTSLLVGRQIETFVPFTSPLLALIQQVFISRNPVNEYDIELGMPHKGRRFVDVQVTLIAQGQEQGEGQEQGQGDESEQVLVLIRPRSIASKIDQQLTHRGAARSVSGMAAMLAHEIKNPLSGIRGAAQLLETELDDDNRRLTNLICSETDRLANLVDRFEIFTEPPKDISEEINIHTILQHVCGLAKSGFAKNINIREIYDPSLPPLKGNKDQLIQAFLNLVKNAAEAVDRENGEIILMTGFRPGLRLALPGEARRESKGETRRESTSKNKRTSLPFIISIIDNGAGIAPDLQPIIFEPFVTDKPNGTGLGLALVAKIISDHGGVIECDSRAGQTIFRVLMPMASPIDSPDN